MPSTFAPIDASTITALNQGGERALEQIFRDHYPWLIERALERLKGENAAAPRLIAATVRELWDERDGFHTSAEIEAFFTEELRHRARAIRARMTAVHRFEKAEGVHLKPANEPPTADQLWKDIADGLHQPQVDAAAVAKRRREQRSHDVAEHISEVAQRSNWRTPVIVVAVATVLALAGAWWFTGASRAAVISQLLGSAEAIQVNTRAGQMGSTTLSDGSQARVAPETRLTIVPRFGSDYRTLSVAGAATFNVASDNANDFEARLGAATVYSSGGRFSVRDYADEPWKMVRAEEGALRVRLEDGGTRSLAEGEALRIGRDGAAAAPSDDELLQAFAWTGDELVLRDVSVAQAASALWRWYGMDVTVMDSVAAENRLSIRVPLGSSQGAIAAIEGGGQVRFQYVEGRMTLQAARARR